MVTASLKCTPGFLAHLNEARALVRIGEKFSHVGTVGPLVQLRERVHGMGDRQGTWGAETRL